MAYANIKSYKIAGLHSLSLSLSPSLPLPLSLPLSLKTAGVGPAFLGLSKILQLMLICILTFLKVSGSLGAITALFEIARMKCEKYTNQKQTFVDDFQNRCS